jgi:hypothetical protein
VRAAQAFVPVIIRRPHAYDFLMQAFAERVTGGEDVRGSNSGLQVGELELPIPGFYVLDADGKVLAKTGLGSAEDVLAVLRAHQTP